MMNYLSFLQLEALCEREAGISKDKIDPAARRFIINNKMMKIYLMLDGLNDPFYNRITLISLAADQERLADFTLSGGIITAIDATNNQITRSSGVFTAGSILAVSISEDSGQAIAYEFVARVTVGGATCTYELISGTDTTLTAARSASVIVLKSMSAYSVSLATLYVKDVVNVWDQTAGVDRQFRPVKDPLIFRGAAGDPLYASEVVWHHSGESLYFVVGSSATALGTVYMEYRTKPTTYEVATESNVILIPPEYNQMLIDEVVASFMLQGGKEVPTALASRLESAQKAYDSAAAERVRASEIRGKRGG